MTPDKAVSSGLELCKSCFTPRELPGDRAIVAPPARVWAIVLGIMGAVVAVGVGIGFFAAVEGGTPPVASTVIGGWAALSLWLLPSGQRRASAFQNREWKRDTVARLGLTSTPLARLPFVIFVPQPWRPVGGSSEDVGILAETSDGLVFVGARCPESIGFRGIRAVSVEKVFLGGMRPWCARLDLEDGSQRWISVREESRRETSRALTEALAEQLRAKIGGA
jgi:hypothetical protein